MGFISLRDSLATLGIKCIDDMFYRNVRRCQGRFSKKLIDDWQRYCHEKLNHG